jgi:hypothetical protein
MILKALHVYPQYGSTDYRATIEFQGDHGKVELRLEADISKRLLEVCADLVAEAGEATALKIRESVQAAIEPDVPQIEAVAAIIASDPNITVYNGDADTLPEDDLSDRLDAVEPGDDENAGDDNA